MTPQLFTRESYHFFVFQKGRPVPVTRFDHEDLAMEELRRQAAACPAHTFILGRELVRAKAEAAHG